MEKSKKLLISRIAIGVIAAAIVGGFAFSEYQSYSKITYLEKTLATIEDANSIRNDLSSIESSMATKDEVNEVKDKLDSLEDTNATKEDINNINKELEDLDEKISDKSDIDELNDRIDEIHDMIETPKDIERIRSEQKGGVMISYFDAFARQPDIQEALDAAKDVLLSAINEATTINEIYGLALLGGSAEGGRYNVSNGSGVFDAIARYMEGAETMLHVLNYSVNDVKTGKTSAKAEMIGFASSSLFEALARQPEVKEDLITYSTSINSCINKLLKDDDCYAIGYAASSLYNAIARQSEKREAMWEQFTSYISEFEMM